MKTISKPAPVADPARHHAVIYARVSSKEQEKEGFSIPAQLKLLKEYAAGLLYPKSGAKVPVSTVHTILRNRLYTGWFEWNGKLIQGKHEALVPVKVWERVPSSMG